MARKPRVRRRHTVCRKCHVRPTEARSGICLACRGTPHALTGGDWVPYRGIQRWQATS